MQKRFNLKIILLIAIRTVLNTTHRMIYPFLPVFSRGLGVDLTSISYLLSTRSLAGMLSPFIAPISDKRGRKVGMLLGMGVYTAGVLLVVLWPTYIAFFASLTLASLGKTIFDPAMQAFLGDRVPYKHRGRTLALTELSWSISFILGVPLIGFIIARNGWMGPFPILISLGLLSMALLHWALPQDALPDTASLNLQEAFNQVLKYSPALWGLSAGLFTSIANELINIVFGVWLADSFGLKIAALGASAGVIGVAELLGESGVAAFSDRIGKKRAVITGLLCNSLVAMMMLIFTRGYTSALLMLLLFYLTFEFTIVSIVPIMTELVPNARVTFMASNFAGFSLGRAIAAFLAPHLYGGSFMINVAASIFMNLCALYAIKRLPVER